jgi:hypothetical protein
MRLLIYDVESYPNFFSVDFCGFETGQHKYFEISDFRDDSKALLKTCHSIIEKGIFLVGFNNINYDMFLIEHFLRNPSAKAYDLYEVGNNLFKSKDLGDPVPYISPKKRLMKQIDLFKINHYDNKARMTSLKAIQFTMRYSNLQDLPFPPGTWLTEDQAKVIRRYNPNDTNSTRDFAEKNIAAINFRAELKKKYPYKDWFNMSDVSIGRNYLTMRLEEAGIECYKKDENGERIAVQTIREEIDLNDAILPWIRFDIAEFQNVLDWMVRQRISETEGVFTNNEKSHYNSCGVRIERIPKKIEHLDEKIKNEIIDTIKLPDHPSKYRYEYMDGSYSIVQEPLNAKVNGFQFDFGTGGIHGSVKRQVFESDDDFEIVDIDVESYYPRSTISNRFYPEHLREDFCDVCEELSIERRTYDKGTPGNKILKLALNGGTFGDTNADFSVFYDPLHTMKVTLNGQLLLCKLCEMMWGKIKNILLIQVNTDGITVKINRCDRPLLNQVVDEWEKLVNLKMEFVNYSKMIVRDVNNYIAVSVDGKIKRKGVYEYELDWHKNHSSLVIPKIAEKVLLEGVDPMELLESWLDPMDFMIKAKVQRTGKFILQVQEDEYEEIQKTSRVYVSNDGCEMFKLLPPIDGKPEPKKGFFKYEDENWRKIAFMKGRKISVANDLSDVNLDEIQIDYDFYLDEINKLTNGLTKEVIHEC